MIPFPEEDENPVVAAAASSYTPKKNIYPISFILTPFHVLLLYPNHVTAVSLLNYQIVYEEYFIEQYGTLLDIVKDVQTDTIYVFSGKNLFRYKITNEQRNVWRMYLDKNEFELARKYATNSAHLDIVLVKQAELAFERKDYVNSAIIYSETQFSFEGICLKFLDINEKGALMIFLRNRLESLEPQDKTQMTMLCVWMFELYLTEMARFADDQSKVRQLQKEFDSFKNLPKVVKCIRHNRPVIYDLLASHGDNFNLTTLTTENKDYESVVNQYINQNNFLDALSILSSQNRPELFYKYCPILMEEKPKETTAALKAQGTHLEPVKLLPTLICLESDVHVNEVIKYLDFCINLNGCTEQAIHNFLVKLYGQYKQKDLMTYLVTQGKDVTQVHYDVHYALR